MNNLSGVQTSVYAALTTAPATYRVYDAVQQGVALPYFVIGEWTEEPGEELATVNSSATFNLHVWAGYVAGQTTQKTGKKEIHEMLDFARIRLDGQPVAGSWLCVEDFVEIMEDPASTAASRLYHGVARYLLLVEDGGVLPPLGQFDMEQFA